MEDVQAVISASRCELRQFSLVVLLSMTSILNTSKTA